MSGFAEFASSLLSSLSSFLWSDAMRWVVGCIVLLFIICALAKILNYIHG